MHITLPSHIKDFVEQEVASGRFADEREVIVAALAQMADEPRIDPDILAELIAEPLAQIERGEVFAWNDDLRADIKRAARENLTRGHEVRDDVKY